MDKIKEFMADHLTDLIAISAGVYFVLGCWCLYTANRAANDYRDVHDTVQSIESDNREARQQIGNASEQIKHAQNKLNDSIKRTGEITNRVNNAQKRIDGNAEIIGECQNLIDAGRRDTAEARGIFADIDKANKVKGTQADGHA